MEPNEKIQDGLHPCLGLSTRQALSRLQEQLSSALSDHQQNRTGSWRDWRRSFVYHGNRSSCFHWPGAALMLIATLLLLCCYGSQPDGSQGSEVGNACALALLLLLDLFLMRRHERLKEREVEGRLRSIITQIDDLFPPFSPPPSPRTEGKRVPQFPQQHHLFRVLKTPVMDNVRSWLDQALSRRVTALDNERFTVQSVILIHAVPVIMVAFLITNVLRLIFHAPGIPSTSYALLQLQVNAVLPVLPLLFPVMWILVTALCEARVLAQMSRKYPSSLVICCVDKQGVLSWPNPSPETVLFFSGRVDQTTERHDDMTDQLSLRSYCQTDLEDEPQEMVALLAETNNLQLVNEQDSIERQSDLTRPSDPQRKPHSRNKHASGSNVSFSQDTGGFTPGAKDLFKLQNHIALYHLPSEEPVKETLLSKLPTGAKRKPPLSHMISLFVRDVTTNTEQMLSHGTADIILEACTDFWDGADIFPLSGSDRKKVLDFYQRACLSGYCSAFSYKPMHYSLSPQLYGKCIEMQHGLGHGAISAPCDVGGNTPMKHTGRHDSWSSDGIGEVTEDFTQAMSGQIFMGMVSSQYQARLDIVRLIDGLVNACIRFVYFSMEDELRSKVFAEKMGLETGWNCHISLTPNGDGPGSEVPPSSPSHAGSLRDDLHQASREDAEGLLLMDDEGHSDMISFQPTDSDVPSFFEDSNRAKLPRGIHQVRPHLQNIDNVPLLVPLFTDCTPETMCEMIQIMQEYGEVTCCIGSSASIRNSGLFSQSDISISLDPLFPSRCSWEMFGYVSSSLRPNTSEEFSPLHLSAALNSLPCSISFRQEDSVSIIRLIEQARHATYGIRKCFLFLLQCQLTLVIVQFLACLIQLPPCLSTTDILWLSCFCFPLLSVSLLGKPSDNSIMTLATGKNLQSIPRKTQHYFLLCFLLKFLPSVVCCLACSWFSLQTFCEISSHSNITNCSGIAVYSDTPGAPDWFGSLSAALLLAQKLCACLIVLHTVFISVSHVHRSMPLWKRNPFSNVWWSLTLPVL
ncbi:hypothetical protein GDO78_004119 [Eleutherodactylus coqui]|uniref:Transmembrane protein 94 n=1 Tax=Eleutherodactylus coqui TaxID=57060 RepID=A0A8J6JZU5_ELECQ|nr:hypothetical protein GDO78_004119 [Eleutherodactylus coqui]